MGHHIPYTEAVSVGQRKTPKYVRNVCPDMNYLLMVAVWRSVQMKTASAVWTILLAVQPVTRVSFSKMEFVQVLIFSFFSMDPTRKQDWLVIKIKNQQ